MSTFTVNAPEGAIFLDEWMQKIPTNCVLNKVVTGCGATSLAIKQPGNTIIAVPFVGLIQNKVAQHRDTLLGIYGAGSKTQEIGNYISCHDSIKIMTTYDSLPKVCSCLCELGLNPYCDSHLVVDEWHLLFQSYLFRNNAVKNLLAEAQKFEMLTYVSATPIERCYWLQELRHLPEFEIKWPEVEAPKTELIKVDRPLEYMASLCHARIENGGETNFHIFLNSVRGISKILQMAKLMPSDARVICSKSENAEKRNQSILPQGFIIASTTDPVKPINFYTSTCFEGQDIYDENGRSFIVSDGFTDHTKIDISTSLIQICGRIRDSRYNNHITQIFSTSRYKGVSFDEFVASLKKDVADAEHDVALMGQMSERAKKRWLLKAAQKGDPFIIVTDDEVKVDRNMANLEIVNFKILNGYYASLANMVKAHRKNGLVVKSAIEDTADPITLPAPNSAKLKFKDVFEEYCELKTHSMFDIAAHLRMERIMFDKPLVMEAYEKLGADEVRKLKYKVRDIRRAITVKWRADESVKIVKLVNAKIRKQTPIPSKKVKEVLQGIYKDLDIEGTAKATDLAKWYEIKQTTARIDGISTSCITIVRPLINMGI